MIKIKDLLFEEISGNAYDLAAEIEKTIRKHFPNSFISVYFNSNIHPSISIRFTIGKDKSEWANGIIQNDPLWQVLMISSGINRNGDIVGKLSLERISGGSFAIKPEPGSHLAFGRHKVPFRKVSGDSRKIISGVDKYFSKVKSELKKSIDKFYDKDISLIKSKI